MTEVSKRVSQRRPKNLAWAEQWIDRARKDYSAFRKMVTFDSKTRKAVPCSDPALSVYLLQQAVEKVMKAVAIASGQYSYHQISRFYSHNSLALFANLYLKLIEAMRVNGIAPMFVVLGFNLDDEEKKLRDLEENARKTRAIDGEIPYVKQFATLPTEQIDKLLDLIDLTKQKAILKTLRDVWGPHNKIEINLDDIHVETPDEFAKSFFQTVGSKLNMPMTEDSMRAILTYLEILKNIGITVTKEKETEKTITISRNTGSYMGIVAIIVLLNLVALTYPHESSSRYPKTPTFLVSQEKGTGLGCEDYNYSLGIVNRLGRLGHVTGLMLGEIKPHLGDIAGIFEIKPLLKPNLKSSC